VERRPFSRVLAVSVVGGCGALVTGLTIWGVRQSTTLPDPGATAVIRGLFVAAYVAVGLYTWWRRPDSKLGALLVGAGFVFGLTSFVASANDVAYAVGRVSLAALVVYLAYVFLCFPRDRLATTLERRLVLGLAVATGVGWVLALALTETLPSGGALADCGSACPANPFRVEGVSAAVSDAVRGVVSTVTAAGLIGLAVVLAYKWRTQSPLARRAVEPVLAAVIALDLSYVVFTLAREAGAGAEGFLRVMTAASGLAIPFALLLGEVRGRVLVATSLARLLDRVEGERVTPKRIQSLIREALGDPTLELVLWDPGRHHYVDVEGAPVEPGNVAAGRELTPVLRDGRRVAFLVHDPRLEEVSEVVDGLTATSFVLLENTRLVEELRASRSRLVDTAQQERLRLERNLHDGAQQRLVNIQIKVADAQAHTADAGLAAELEEIGRDAAAAVEELRELAHGLYPTVLRERGLADAVRSFGAAAPLSVRVVDDGVGRCSPWVEEGVYFCVLEAIQNAVKHAGPGATVTVTIARPGEEIVFSITDDGPGFDLAVRSAGSGLVGMRDRIGAIGGELELVSRRGSGTTVRGVVPAGSTVAPG
jgi:signal transduction histidine kinase